MNGLDLFSGIGGISLALKPWVRTIAYCEQDRYCQGVLLSKMSKGEIDRAPIWDDVRTLQPDMFNVSIDIISGGFPCQNISSMGNRKGLEGESSGLFREIVRLVDGLRPCFVFLENVPAISVRGGTEVVNSLAAIGYDCRWGVFSAGGLGAPHLRARWWLVAHIVGKRLYTTEDEQFFSQGIICDMFARKIPVGIPKRLDPATLGRGIYGVPFRMDRIKSLGNSVVPACARKAFKKLTGIEE